MATISENIKCAEAIKESIQHLESKGWSFVKAREYQETYIFKSSNGKNYLHFGNPDKIQKNIDIQSKLYKLGYPVAAILKTGNFGRFSYLLESSLGEETYGDVFTKNIEDQKFKLFCSVIASYFEAQLKNQLPVPIDFDIRKEVMAKNVIQENSDLGVAKINSALDKLEQGFRTLPFAYSHGDFAARNILDKGVIDFEFCSIAPIGLDVFNACTVENFWMYKNSSDEFCAKFYFEVEQNEYLVDVLNTVSSRYGLTRLLEFQNDFILFKAIWSTAHEKQQSIKSGDDTKWRFRRAILMYCIEKYLKDEKINPFKFKDLKNI